MLRWGRCSPPGTSLGAGPVRGRRCLGPCRIPPCSLQLPVSDPWNGGTSSSVPDTPFPSWLVVVPQIPQVSCLPLAPSSWDPVSGSPRGRVGFTRPLPAAAAPRGAGGSVCAPITPSGVGTGHTAGPRSRRVAPWGALGAERAARRGSGSFGVLLCWPFKSFSPTAERAVGGTWAALCANQEPGMRSLSLIGSRQSRPVALGTGREGPRGGGLGRRLSPGSLDGGVLGTGTSLGPFPEDPWGSRRGCPAGSEPPPPSSAPQVLGAPRGGQGVPGAAPRRGLRPLRSFDACFSRVRGLGFLPRLISWPNAEIWG